MPGRWPYRGKRQASEQIRYLQVFVQTYIELRPCQQRSPEPRCLHDNGNIEWSHLWVIIITNTDIHIPTQLTLPLIFHPINPNAAS